MMPEHLNIWERTRDKLWTVDLSVPKRPKEGLKPIPYPRWLKENSHNLEHLGTL